MAGRVSQQKAFVVRTVRDLIAGEIDEDGKFKGASLKEEDSSTLVLEVPGAWSPTRYVVTVRERMVG